MKKTIILFSILLGSLAGVAQKEFKLTGDFYYRNDQPMRYPVDITIYDWEYFVINAFPEYDTIPYNHIVEYRAGRDSTLRHVILPAGSIIDSLSLGWDSNCYIGYKDNMGEPGDVYRFPNLVYVKKRKHGSK